MDDLISRQAAIDAVKTYWKKVVDDIPKGVGFEELTQLCSMALEHNANILKAIDQLPSAQPERMRGKWIERNPQNSDKCRLIECDQCGFSHIVGFNVPYEHWIENRNFCERCGADMRGEQDE